MPEANDKFVSTELFCGIAVAVPGVRASEMSALTLYGLGIGSLAITVATFIIFWLS
jgi:hypothetical protein